MNSSSWLVPFTPARSGLQLLCFPCAGGAASAYRAWGAEAPPEVEVIGVELPGHGRRLREPLLTSMDEVADGLFEAVRGRLRTPFAFFGHSFGGYVAYELALRVAAGLSMLPTSLTVCGTPFPPTRKPQAETREEPNDAALLRRLRRLGGTPGELLENPGLLELILPVLQADIDIAEAYSPPLVSPLGCTITALTGTEDRTCTPERLSGWRQVTHGVFDIRVFSGDHFFLRTAVGPVLDAVLSGAMAGDRQPVR